MKKYLTTLFILSICASAFSQLDKEQFALDVSKAEAANTEKLKAFIWKRHSTATVKGEVKATIINEVSFNETGEIQVMQVGEESDVKQKRGIRGRVQKNAIEDNMEYVEKALKLALAYTYMSKGQLLDFFEKATVNDAGNNYELTASNVYEQGDKLTVLVEKSTKLFINKKFSSTIDGDLISGEIVYDKFSSGISHGAKTEMKLPGKDAVIDAVNKDYTQRIQ